MNVLSFLVPECQEYQYLYQSKFRITDHKHKRFEHSFNSPSVKLLHIKDSAFVLINSMAMEGDGCSMCAAAEHDVQQISRKLTQICDCRKVSYACSLFVVFS